MKRIAAVTIVLVLLVFAVAAVAAPGSKRGAVKVDLNAYNPGLPDGPAVGWAVANTTGDGRLVGQVHLYDGMPGDLLVTVESPDDGVPLGSYVVDLYVNAKGKGNVHLDVPVVYDGDGTVEFAVGVWTQGGDLLYRSWWQYAPAK